MSWFDDFGFLSEDKQTPWVFRTWLRTVIAVVLVNLVFWVAIIAAIFIGIKVVF